jgi:citrate lyase beta subunit
VNLRAGLGAVFLGEEDVVVLAGVEGRVEIDKIDRLVLDVALKDFEVIAVIETVFVSGHGLG